MQSKRDCALKKVSTEHKIHKDYGWSEILRDPGLKMDMQQPGLHVTPEINSILRYTVAPPGPVG